MKFSFKDQAEKINNNIICLEVLAIMEISQLIKANILFIDCFYQK